MKTKQQFLPQTISEVFLAKFQLGPEYSAWFLIFLFAPFAVSISNQLVFEYYKTVLKKKFHVSFDNESISKYNNHFRKSPSFLQHS